MNAIDGTPGASADSRILIMMRHGKSDYPGGVTDHQRPLADRGRVEAALAGDWLREHLPPVDAVLCSTAERTRETLVASGIEATTIYSGDIYEASVPDVLAVIGRTDDAAAVLLVVGHAPGMPTTAVELAGEDSDQALTDRAATHFPTSAIAVLRFTGPWAGLDTHGAVLTDFVIPRPTR